MLRCLGTTTALAIAAALPCNAQLRAQASATECTLTPLSDTAFSRRDSTLVAARDSSGARRTDSSAASDRPSIVLYASASAREVRFAAQPRIAVRLCGAVTDSVHVIERRNLPARVQPGVTYRDVFIAVEIIGHLNADCLAQRIGVADRPVAAGACASLQVRDSTGAAPVRRPPE